MSDPKQFYFQQDESVLGPFTGVELREKAFSGTVTPDTLVRVGQSGEWIPARQLKNLFGSDGMPLPHPPETQEFLEKAKKGAAGRWYVRQGVRVLGPFSSGELRAKADSGEITPRTRIMKGAQGTWAPAARVNGLFPLAPEEIEAIAAEVLLSPILLDDPAEEEGPYGQQASL